MNKKVQVKEKNKVQSLVNNKNYKFLYLLLFLPCFLVGRDLNSDIWFILNSGKYVLQNGFPYIEPFTIHEGMSFVMQQWLSAVTFWSAYSIMGELGLILFVSLVYMLFVYIAFRLCMLLSDNNFPVSYGVSFIVIALIFMFMTQRPYIFLFLFILIELYCLEKYIKSNKAVYLFPLLVLSVLLINLQAAMWPLLFVILLPYVIDSFRFKFMFIEGQGYSSKPLYIIILGMLAAAFLNPYGIKAMTYLFTSYGFEEINKFVGEMSVANINNLNGKIIFSTIFLVFLLLFIYKKGSYRLRYYLLALGTAYMAISSVRSYSIFIICGIIPLSYYLKDFKTKEFEDKRDKKTLLIRKLLIILLVLSLTPVMYKKYTYSDSKHQDLVKSVDQLENLIKADINLYTGYDDGGYLEFRGFKVYLDPRAEVFLKSNNKKDDIMKEFASMQSGTLYYKEVLNKYNFTHLLVSKNDILNAYLPNDENYKPIYSSTYYTIYESNSFKK